MIDAFKQVIKIGDRVVYPKHVKPAGIIMREMHVTKTGDDYVSGRNPQGKLVTLRQRFTMIVNHDLPLRSESAFAERMGAIKRYNGKADRYLPNAHRCTLVAIGAVDTGLELVELTAIALDSEFEPLEIKLFNACIKPQHHTKSNQRTGIPFADLQIAGNDRDFVASEFVKWWQQLGGKILPVAFHWQRVYPLLQFAKDMFADDYRDPIALAMAMNDAAWYQGKKIPFPNPTQTSLRRAVGVEDFQIRNATAQAVDVAKVYRRMLHVNENHSQTSSAKAGC